MNVQYPTLTRLLFWRCGVEYSLEVVSSTDHSARHRQAAQRQGPSSRITAYRLALSLVHARLNTHRPYSMVRFHPLQWWRCTNSGVHHDFRKNCSLRKSIGFREHQLERDAYASLNQSISLQSEPRLSSQSKTPGRCRIPLSVVLISFHLI